MTEIPGIVYLCMLVGWVAIGLAVVNAIFWHRNKGSGAPTPKSLRRAWSISLASLLVPYLALISLPILGFLRLGRAAGIQSPPPYAHARSWWTSRRRTIAAPGESTASWSARR